MVKCFVFSEVRNAILNIIYTILQLQGISDIQEANW
jgi:hypothetical protein